MWVRVGTNSFGHPDFEWRDLSTDMLHKHKNRQSALVLLPVSDRPVGECNDSGICR